MQLLKSILPLALALASLGSAQILQAQTPPRILDAQSVTGFGAGWDVDPKNGYLNMRFPVGTLGGDIPVPVVLRYNATHQVQVETIHPVGQPAAVVVVDRPIQASLHFGYITAANQVIDGRVIPQRWVLEDGSQLSWPTQGLPGGSFTLPAAFNLPGVAAAIPKVTSDGRFALYTTDQAGLGAWTEKWGCWGFGSTTQIYQVLMDQDRARVFQFIPPLNAWVPMLWIDRFGHSVTFWWERNYHTMGMVDSVRVENHLGKAVCVQWLVGTPSSAAIEADLMRVDWINVQAPGLLVRGYPSVSLSRPAGIGVSGGTPVAPMLDTPFFQGRPTQIRLGNPDGFPSFPAQFQAMNEVPWAGDLTWSFDYDVNQCQLQSFTDALAVQTSLTYNGETCFVGADLGSYFLGLSNANGVDLLSGGCGLTQSWTRIVPSWTSNGWSSREWKGTHTRGFTTGAGGPKILEYNFAPPTQDKEFNIGALLSVRQLDGSQEWSKVSYRYHYGGSDGNTLVWESQTTTRTNEPTRVSSRSINGSTNLPDNEQLTVGGVPTQYTVYTWEGFPDRLNPGRLTQVTTTRQGSDVAEPQTTSQKIEYNGQGLPTKQYLDAGSLQKGTYTDFDGEGRPIGSGSHVPGYSGAPSKTFHLNGNGFVDEVTTHAGAMTFTQSYGVTSMGQVTSEQDMAGITTYQDIDSLGRVTEVRRAGTPTVSYSYPSERQRSITSSDGRSGGESYDGFGRLLSRTRLNGVQEAYSYDRVGRVIGVTETASGSVRSRAMEYDPLGRMKSQSQSGRPEVTLTYSVAGSNPRNTVVTSTAGSDGSSVSRDPWGQVVQQVSVLGVATSTSYDGSGQATLVTQGAQTRRFSYNPIGFLTSRTEPETGTTTFGDHTALGQPRSIQEEDNRVRTLTYDGLGRMTYQVSDTASLSFHYTGMFLDSSTTTSPNGLVSQTFEYTNNGYQLSKETTSFGGQSYVTGYTLDGYGRLTDLAYPTGRLVHYGYSAGRLSSVSVDNVILAGLQQDAWGNLTDLTFASGATSHWGYDAIGGSLGTWTATPVGGGSELRTYGYDARGFVSSITPDWTQLVHDPGGRITQAEGFGFMNTLSHDSYDNNTSSVSSATTGSVPPTMNNFTFTNPLLDQGGNVSNRLPGMPPAPPNATTGWDYNGRGEATRFATGMSTQKNHYPAWDGLGRLVHVGGDNEMPVQDYLYAPSGMRVQLMDSSDPTRNRRYVYTGGGLLLSEIGPAQAGHGSQKAVQVFHKTGTASALSRCLGAFPAGATVTASVWFKAPVGVSGAMALHDGKVGSAGDSKKFVSMQGNGGWQQLNLSLTLQRADTLWIHLYGDMFTETSGSATDATSVVYDDVLVNLGTTEVLKENFEGGLNIGTDPTSTLAWYGCGQVNQQLGTSTTPDAWRRDVIYAGSLAIAEIDAQGIHELHSDHLGSPRVVTAGKVGMSTPLGQIEGKLAFASYGERIEPSPLTSGYSPLTGYTGHIREDATGLIYMRGRYFSPAWHRFLNSDQGVDPNQFNQYAYVGGRTFSGRDPSGYTDTGGKTGSFDWWIEFWEKLLDALLESEDPDESEIFEEMSQQPNTEKSPCDDPILRKFWNRIASRWQGEYNSGNSVGTEIGGWMSSSGFYDQDYTSWGRLGGMDVPEPYIGTELGYHFHPNRAPLGKSRAERQSNLISGRLGNGNRPPSDQDYSTAAMYSFIPQYVFSTNGAYLMSDPGGKNFTQIAGLGWWRIRCN